MYTISERFPFRFSDIVFIFNSGLFQSIFSSFGRCPLWYYVWYKKKNSTVITSNGVGMNGIDVEQFIYGCTRDVKHIYQKKNRRCLFISVQWNEIQLTKDMYLLPMIMSGWPQFCNNRRSRLFTFVSGWTHQI